MGISENCSSWIDLGNIFIFLQQFFSISELGCSHCSPLVTDELISNNFHTMNFIFLTGYKIIHITCRYITYCTYIDNTEYDNNNFVSRKTIAAFCLEVVNSFIRHDRK